MAKESHRNVSQRFSSNGVLYSRAEATWKVPKANYCAICDKQKTRAASVPIGVQKPAPLRFGNDVFSLTGDVRSDMSIRQNLISAFVFGWLYVFSAEMVERMQEDSHLVYTDSRAELTADDDGDVIDAKNGEQPYSPEEMIDFISPWSTTADGGQQTRYSGIKVAKLPGYLSLTAPPFSQQALGFLVDFRPFYGI
ncbi:uncharacterized protein BO97DRAFT_421390 [Aspergillus homomorphus CBS 101889]|uniref:Uncharacterized protein n=1 Tax=Aspergillus homomorphus (strain CBS 101889) TaxID=1450537 RepID=A0A395I888_ASPHC|nr:hypothetical protein BO97DRAFT_421390 [Aspergillus homomorphus CBS 101889]RAL16165.1 hypothetical protein BO97DRAFT_421390 [Aspergillus homomorphus CBS 101889]